MNVYKSVGYTVGTPEALALSERLSAWHDSMVAHERTADTARLARCDDDCPQSDAQLLWREAVETFGPHAQTLRFLRRHGSQCTVARNGQAEGAAGELTAMPWLPVLRNTS